jgi:ubiquinone/menaquinone biosynthesis C-methylase UbiE
VVSQTTQETQCVEPDRGRELRRLHLLHDVYAEASRRTVVAAGLRPGMAVADFGCGVGLTTRMLTALTGQFGIVTGIDIDPVLLRTAKHYCALEGAAASFVQADACRTGLPRESFDVVYCRLLLLHLPNPIDCLREMSDVLRPGGIIVVEDSDLATATSVPATAISAFGDLFGRFGPLLGLDVSGARTLYHKMKSVGFANPRLELRQPAITEGEQRNLLRWSVEEASASFLDAGVATRAALDRTLRDMQEAIDNRDVLILAPQMWSAWARKPLR